MARAVEPIDVAGLHGNTGRRAEVEQAIEESLRQLASLYPQFADSAKRRLASRELIGVLDRLSVERDPSMAELVATLRGVRLRGVGEANTLWPRLFVTSQGPSAPPLNVALMTAGSLVVALHELFRGYLDIDPENYYWALAAIAARRPASIAELHACLTEAGAELPLAFDAAWAPNFRFHAVHRQPDWSEYWKHERPTAYGGGYPASIRNFLESFFDRLREARPEARVLDIGTGNHGATELARRRGPRFELYGIDLSIPSPSAEAASSLAVMDANCLAFADATFDAVVSVNGIEYADPDKAIPEMGRVLVTGGHTVLVLHHPDSDVVKRARSVNRFVREQRLHELVVLTLLYLECKEPALKVQIDRQLARARMAFDIPQEPFFEHLWQAVGLALSSGDRARSIAGSLEWCDRFFGWLLRKNDYVTHHAALLGADRAQLARLLGNAGVELIETQRLRADYSANSMLALGIVGRKR